MSARGLGGWRGRRESRPPPISLSDSLLWMSCGHHMQTTTKNNKKHHTHTHSTPTTHNAHNTEHAKCHRQFCLPKFAHVRLSLDPRGSPKKPLDLTHVQFENRSRTTCSRFLQSFALPDKVVQLPSPETLWRESVVVRFVFRPCLQAYRTAGSTQTHMHTRAHTHIHMHISTSDTFHDVDQLETRHELIGDLWDFR